jgi:hypothetical protein
VHVQGWEKPANTGAISNVKEIYDKYGTQEDFEYFFLLKRRKNDIS